VALTMPRRVFQRLLLTAFAAAVPQLHAQEPSLTVRLQAAIVSKTPQFVRWPSAALAGRASLNVCVLAIDPFAEPLQAFVSGDAIEGRPIAVRILERDQDVDSCHVLFLSSRAVNARPAMLQRAVSRPVLTISDDDRFFDKGGIVKLRLVNGRMKFDVNLEAAQRAGLQISSQFLQLAATVRGHA
jgi:hypothetical protein